MAENSMNITKTNTNMIPDASHTQTGGVKLGQGGFGCVITPAVPCRKRPAPINAVSKITYVIPGYEEDYENELHMLKKIKSIDPDQKYFVSVSDECKLDTRESIARAPKDLVEVSYEDDDLEEFTVKSSEPKYISRMNKSDIKKNYCLIDSALEPRNQIQVFGGYELSEIDHNKHPQVYRAIQQGYKQIIKHLLHGLEIMHKNRIAHRDIKEFNMLGMLYSVANQGTQRNTQIQKRTQKRTKSKRITNIKNNKKNKQTPKSTKTRVKPLVRFIDFGLSELINPQLDEGGIRNFHWLGTDGYIPVEFIILYYMRDYVNVYGTGVLSNPVNKQKIIAKVQDRYQRKYKYFYDDIHVEQSLMSPKRMTYQFFNQPSVSKLYDNLAKSLSDRTFYKLLKTDYTGLVYKSDVFALGITLGFMRRHYRLQHDRKLTDLITKMIKISSAERPTIKECLAHPFCTS